MAANGISLPAIAPTYLDTTIPGVMVTGKNTTNTAAGSGPGAAASSANTVTAGTWGTPVFAPFTAASTAVGTGWKYDASTTTVSNSGIVCVNSAMLDMSNIS